MAATIVLGIAVDDSIHFLTYLKRNMKRLNFEEALSLTLSEKMPAMICTSSVLICGFGLLLTASFPPVSQLGVLAAGAFVMALISVLSMPVILRILLKGRKA